MVNTAFDPSKFTAPKAKPLPVILLLDVSGSMSGEKIRNLNDAVRDMLNVFGDTENGETEIWVAIITFGAQVATVDQAIEIGTTRLNAAQRALDAYLGTNPPAAEFHAWLKWNPAQNGRPVTPDTLRDRMNLSSEQRRLFQEYLYDRNPAYRKQVDKYRNLWATARGDAERNIVARKARIQLSGEFGEQMARHALAPLGGRIETQGRTFVGDNGRYTKTDLLVTDLRVPVILGRGEGMGACSGTSTGIRHGSRKAG